MRAEVYYDDLGKDIRDEDIPAAAKLLNNALKNH